MTWNWRHLVHIRGAVRRLVEGEIRFLMINCPPRHGKSEQVTIRLPPFLLERDPTQRFITAAYNNDLAKLFSLRSQRLYCGDLDPAMSGANDWQTAEGGGLRAAGVGTGVTGRGANGILIDDPVKNRTEAISPTYRATVWNWWLYDLSTRLEPNGFVILTMTRWHHDDLAGRILASADAPLWYQVNLPALAGANDELGRREGEALCPQRFDENKLAVIKTRLGDGFDALYQGKPTPDEGSIFKREWFRRYNPAQLRDAMRKGRIVLSWDCANKASQLNDWTVCTIWALMPNNDLYLLGVYRKRVQYPELRKVAEDQAKHWNAYVTLVEDKGNGTALIQDLRTNTRLTVVAIEPEGDKVTRASNESLAYSAGRVFHPEHSRENAGWLVDYESELLTFPSGSWDDQVDSTSQILRWSRKDAATEYAGAYNRAAR
jgi:predicted phage terminase large subunit-like protein